LQTATSLHNQRKNQVSNFGTKGWHNLKFLESKVEANLQKYSKIIQKDKLKKLLESLVGIKTYQVSKSPEVTVDKAD
jgi:hypothetical protein